jgi:hypothetical protein
MGVRIALFLSGDVTSGQLDALAGLERVGWDAALTSGGVSLFHPPEQARDLLRRAGLDVATGGGQQRQPFWERYPAG